VRVSRGEDEDFLRKRLGAYGDGAVKSTPLPETEEIVTIHPFLFSRCGNAAWINFTVPWISVLNAVFQASGVSVTLIDETFDTTTSIQPSL
jgi:hypothetical protein